MILIESQIYILMKTFSAMHAGYQQQVHVFDNCTTLV